MHGLLGFIIIGGCICAVVASFVLFALDMRKSRLGAERRQKLMDRLHK